MPDILVESFEGGTTVMQVMVDFHACRWPSSIPTSHDTSTAEFFDNLNEPVLSNLAENLEMEEEETGNRSPLITFSHFLPLQVRRRPFHRPSASGTDTFLDAQLFMWEVRMCPFISWGC